MAMTLAQVDGALDAVRELERRRARMLLRLIAEGARSEAKNVNRLLRELA